MTDFQPRLLSDGRIACCSQHFPHTKRMQQLVAELRGKGHDAGSALDIATTMMHLAGNAIFEEENRMTYAAAPDPYAAGLASLRAAEATPSSTFEDSWKASRLRSLEAEQTKLDAYVATAPRMTAAEKADLASYAAPDSYAAGLAAMRSGR